MNPLPLRSAPRLAGLAPLAIGCALTALACGGQTHGTGGDGGSDAPADEGHVQADVVAERTTTGDCSAPVEAGQPSLAALEVTAGANALQPAFSPGIHDYYVSCAAGSNSLHVVAKAAPGGTAAIALETPAKPKGTLGATGAAKASQDLTLPVQENQAVVVTAAAGKASEEYWVRCLSSTFPAMQWIEHAGGCNRTPGYYLVGDEQPIGKMGAAYAIIYDTNGVPVWYRLEPSGVFDVAVVVPGTLSFMAATPPPDPEAWEIHDLSTGSVHTVAASDNHELAQLPNGDFLVFTDAVQNGVDLTGYNLTLPGGGKPGKNSAILPCDILEYDTKGTLVKQWIGTDHFDCVQDGVYPQPGPTSLHGTGGIPVEDPLHCNSIDVDPASGNLLVSGRNMDAVFYLDWATGKVLWKMGGYQTTKDGEAYVKPANAFHRQHDARLLPGWDPNKCGGTGQISMFDDETAENSPARGVVYDVSVGTGPGCSPVAAVAWQYYEPIHVNSVFMGSMRVDSDGARIIGWGFGGELNGLIFSEVDSTGNDMLDLVWPDSASYRAIKEPTSAFDVEVLRKTSAQ